MSSMIICAQAGLVPTTMMAALLGALLAAVVAIVVLFRRSARTRSTLLATTMELQRKREFSEGLIQTAPIIILVLDREGRIVRFNEHMETLSGYKLADVEGKDWFETFLPPDERDRIRAVFGEAIGGERTRGSVNPIMTRDGEEREIEWFDTPLHDANGEPIGLLCVGDDVTERTQQLQVLRESQDRLEAIVRTAAEGIITIDQRGTIESVNPAAERMFGYAADDIVGQNVSTLMPAPYAQEHRDYVRAYLETGDAKVIGIGREVVGQRSDGSTFPMDLAVSELYDRTQHVFTGIVRDITDRKRAEEQLRQADRMASLGSLAAGLGHDMNNVLLPVRTRLDVIAASDPPPKLREHLQAIGDSIGYLQQLTDSLHMLALDPEDDDASGQSTDVAIWWEQVGPLLAKSVPKNVRLTTSIPDTTPPMAVAPHRLTQAALNLLVNAGDAVGRDGTIQVWTEVSPDRAHVRFGVTDNGVGMPSNVKRHALDAFFTTKKRGLGTGLGLALVQGIVSAAAGSIDIQSAPGKGTTIVLELPVATRPAVVAAIGELGVAVVTLNDRRIGGLISTVLDVDGFEVRFEKSADPATSSLWIVDASVATIDAARAFAADPGHHVVVCGAVEGDWGDVGATIIEQPGDFEMIRQGITAGVRTLREQALGGSAS